MVATTNSAQNLAPSRRDVPSADASGRSEREGSSLSRPWCELVRDVVALANSGGGSIAVGDLPELEERRLRELVTHFTGKATCDIRVMPAEWKNQTKAQIIVSAAAYPIGFVRPGRCYAAADASDTVELFAAGTFYFRRGGESVPGTTEDVRAFFERLLRRVRLQWLREIRRVVSTPWERSQVAPVQGAPPLAPGAARPVRIVTDPAAPALQPQDIDRLYPWRQMDLLRELNRRLGQRMLNRYDIQAIRRQHGLDQRRDFVFHLAGAGRRYSPVVADWIMEQYDDNTQFFAEARRADRETLKLRRRQPR